MQQKLVLCQIVGVVVNSLFVDASTFKQNISNVQILNYEIKSKLLNYGHGVFSILIPCSQNVSICSSDISTFYDSMMVSMHD